MTFYDKNNPASLRALFNSIAPRYDLGNAVMSCYLHNLWNRRLVALALKSSPQVVLDLCAGTGEITKRMLKMAGRRTYHLLDFSEEMLDIAKKTIPHTSASFYQADAKAIPLGDNSIDVVTIAYGIRNVDDRLTCFKELYRVLKPGAVVCIAELTRPENPFFGALHKCYLKTMVPLIGRALTSNEEAYKYLQKSVEAFIKPEQLVQELEEAGFTNCTFSPQTCGIATLFTADKL